MDWTAAMKRIYLRLLEVQLAVALHWNLCVGHYVDMWK